MDVTPKVILDTNMVYYICGLSSPHHLSVSKVLSYLNENQNQINQINFAISSVSFYELLIHYQKRAHHIRRICSTLKNYHIKIYNDVYLPIEFERPYNFAKIRQQELEDRIAEFLPRKVDVESRFAAAILLILLISEISFDVFPSGEFNSNTFTVLRAVANISQRVTVECLNKAYQSAYKQENVESYIRDEFQRLLAMLLPLGISACKKFANIGETDDIIDYYNAIPKDELEQEREKIERAVERKHSAMRFISRRAITYGRSIGDNTLRDFLQHIWDTTQNTSIANESIKEYIFETVKNTLLHGSAFWKYDIIDAMILGSMTPNDHLITCDKKMLEHMERYQKGHIEYANSLKLIQSFQQ